MTTSLSSVKVVLADGNVVSVAPNIAHVKPMPTPQISLPSSVAQPATSTNVKNSSVANVTKKYLQSTVNINGVLKSVLVPMSDNVATSIPIRFSQNEALAAARLPLSALAKSTATTTTPSRAFYVVSDPTVGPTSKNSNMSIAVPVGSGGSKHPPPKKAASGGGAGKTVTILTPTNAAGGTGALQNIMIPNPAGPASSSMHIILQLQTAPSSVTASSSAVLSTVNSNGTKVQSGPSPTLGTLLKNPDLAGKPVSTGQTVRVLLDSKRNQAGSVYVHNSPDATMKAQAPVPSGNNKAMSGTVGHNILALRANEGLKNTGRPITSPIVQAPVVTLAKTKPLALSSASSIITTGSGPKKTVLVAYPSTCIPINTSLSPNSSSLTPTSSHQQNTLSSLTDDLIQTSSQILVQKLTSAADATAKLGPAPLIVPTPHSQPGFNSGSPLKSILRMPSAEGALVLDGEPEVINIGDSDSQLRIDSVFSLQQHSYGGSYFQDDEDDDDIPMMDEESLNNMKIIEIVPDDDYQPTPVTVADTDLCEHSDDPVSANDDIEPTKTVLGEECPTVDSSQDDAGEEVMRGDNMQVRIAEQAARQMQTLSKETDSQDESADNFTSHGALDFRALLIKPKEEVESAPITPTTVESTQQSNPLPRRGSKSGLKIPRFRKVRKIKPPLKRFRDADKKYLVNSPEMRHSFVKLESLYLSGKITVKANPRTIRLLKTRPLWYKQKKPPKTSSASSTSSTDTAPSPPKAVTTPETQTGSALEKAQARLLDALKSNSVSLASLTPSIRPTLSMAGSAIRPGLVTSQGAPILLRSQGASPRLAFARPVTPNSTSKNKYFLVKTSTSSFLVPVNPENLKLAQSLQSRRDLSQQTLRSLLKPIAGVASVATGPAATTVTVRRTNIMATSSAPSAVAKPSAIDTTSLPRPIATVLHRPTGKSSDSVLKTTVVYPSEYQPKTTVKTPKTVTQPLTTNTIIVYADGTQKCVRQGPSVLITTPTVKQEPGEGADGSRPRKRHGPADIIDLDDEEPITKRPTTPPAPTENAQDRIKRLKESLLKQNEQLARIRIEREESRKALEEIEKDV